MLCVHRLREGFKDERTACINRIRGLLAEFGLVFAQSPEVLSSALPDVLEDASQRDAPWRVGCCSMHSSSGRAGRAHGLVRRAHRPPRQRQRSGAPGATLMGIGPVTRLRRRWPLSATSRSSRTARSLVPGWGIAPRQDSSGGKTSSGGITKRGDTYLRTLLVQGAKSAVMTAHRRSDPISQWALALRERRVGRRRRWRWPTRMRASCGP